MAARKFENALRLSVPHILMLVFLFAGFIAVPGPHASVIKPSFILMTVYYWSIYRPTLVPPVLCFFLGLTMDILSGAPLGLNALTLVVVQWVVSDQRRFLMGQLYITLWGVFGFIAALSFLLQWGLYGLTSQVWPSLMPLGIVLAANMLIFPFVSMILFLAHRVLPVASRALT